MRVGCWVVESGLQREVLQKRGSRRLFSGESFAVSLGGREGTRAWVLRASPWQRSMSSDVQTAELYDVGTGFGGCRKITALDDLQGLLVNLLGTNGTIAIPC